MTRPGSNLRPFGIVPVVLVAAAVACQGSIEAPAGAAGTTASVAGALPTPGAQPTGGVAPTDVGTVGPGAAPAEVPAVGVPAAAPPSSAVPDPSSYYTELSIEQTQAYLSRIAPNVAVRVLSPEERASIETQAGAAIPAVVTSWVTDSGFTQAARLFLEETLGVSGSSSEVDFDLPGNLARHLVQNGLPWAEIITANYCIGGDGQETECDTGAPYAAGVLTTRAFMIARQSRFNLTRASTLMKNFACRGYPMDSTLEPRVEKPSLIPMFQAENPAEQTEPEAANGFGNGFGCYTCHGQFSSHAQLFVKYDREGNYHPDADGLQNAEDELGVSTDGLMASHFANPEQAQSEASQMFGSPTANLAEAAAVIADNPLFVSCTAERFMDYVLGLPRGSVPYDQQLVDNVVLRATSNGPEPTLANIVVALLTEPAVIQSILASGGSAP